MGCFFTTERAVVPEAPKPATEAQIASALRLISQGKGTFHVASGAGITFALADELTAKCRAGEAALTAAISGGKAKSDAEAVAAVAPVCGDIATAFVAVVKENAGGSLPTVLEVVK